MTEFPAVIRLKPADSKTVNNSDTVLNEKNHEENQKEKAKQNSDCFNDSKDLFCENQEQSLKQILLSFTEKVTERLNNIEHRIDIVTDTCDVLEEKVECLSTFISENKGPVYVRSAVSPCSASSEEGYASSISFSPSITYITLNTENDYPDGSWLGDENNPELRVRCHISPTELFHINTTCTTAEKMALTLLDYLFDRETQACSNISGVGKHKKKQLDPLLIYGIHCHLIYHFGINDQDWNRIKQNIDSKCRTAFRRKIRGLPLAPKGIHPSNRISVDKQAASLSSIKNTTRSFALPISTEAILTYHSSDADKTESTVEEKLV